MLSSEAECGSRDQPAADVRAYRGMCGEGLRSVELSMELAVCGRELRKDSGEAGGLPAGGETWGGLGRMLLMITTSFIKHSLWARHWAKQTNVAFHDHHEANAATSPLLQKR